MGCPQYFNTSVNLKDIKDKIYTVPLTPVLHFFQSETLNCN